jgi:hypothetical protein
VVSPSAVAVAVHGLGRTMLSAVCFIAKAVVVGDAGGLVLCVEAHGDHGQCVVVRGVLVRCAAVHGGLVRCAEVHGGLVQCAEVHGGLVRCAEGAIRATPPNGDGH